MSSPLAAPRIAKTFVKLRHTAFQSKDKYFGENWLCMLVLCEHYSLNLVFYNAPFNVTHEPPPPSPFPQSTRGVLKEDKFGCQNPSLISRSESLTHFTVRIPHSFHCQNPSLISLRIPHSFHCQNPSLISLLESLTHFTVRIPNSFHCQNPSLPQADHGISDKMQHCQNPFFAHLPIRIPFPS